MTHLSRRARLAAPGAALGLTAALLVTATSTAAHGRSDAQQRHTEKVPTSVGYGGAVTSVDPEASAAGLQARSRSVRPGC